MLLFDIGNTRIKCGRMVDGQAVASVAFPMQEITKLESNLMAEAAAKPCRRAAISSVNPPIAGRLQSHLKQLGFDVKILQSDGKLFETGLLQSNLQTPETTGVDRLLSAIGALTRAPGCDVVVIDCGSAITVNWTTADRIFQGGAIMPGLRLMAAALHHQTASLPTVKIDSQPTIPGRSTSEAIAAGIFAAVAGGIDRAVQEIQSQIPTVQPVQIFLTGGDSDRIGSALRSNVKIQSNLVLEGLAFAVNATKLEGRAASSDHPIKV